MGNFIHPHKKINKSLTFAASILRTNAVKKKVTYIVSNINKALAFEWVAQGLDKDRFILSFLLLNPGDSALERELRKLDVEVKRIPYRGKKDMPIAFLKVFFWLLKHPPDMVHVHLFDACLIALPAAWLAGIKKRIHTRHSSVYHLEEHPHIVKYDLMINHFSTTIVSISKNVSQVLEVEEGVDKRKIVLIYHGFKLEDFENVSPERIAALQTKYQTKGRHPVIGVISRYIGWKGIQYIIPAFEKLLETHPNALLLLANGNGEYWREVRQLLKNLPPDNFIEIGFEEDLFALYQLFDVFVHVPVSSRSEAFGQTYVEALAAGIPSVFTLSGIASEFITDKNNAIVVDYKNSETIHQSMLELLNNKSLAETITKNGREDVYERFQLNNMLTNLENLYAG